MGLLYYPKITKAQNRIKFYKYSLWHYFLEACTLIASLLVFSINTIFGQVPVLEETISIPKQNTTLYEALNMISQKADCFFIYNSETVESDKNVKLQADNQPLNKVLDNILLNSGLDYKVLGKHILIYKSKIDAQLADKKQSVISAKDTI